MAALGLALSAVGAGAGYQVLASALDARSYPPPGRLVLLGDHRLHLLCTGSGSPTVLLEAGMGSHSAAWAWVQRELASASLTCAYDRAGTGWSDPATGPQDATSSARDLQRLLEVAHLPAPLILVGHSYGGIVSRAYALEHPEAVAGVVLADSAHPEMGSRFPPGIARAFRDQLAGFGRAQLLFRFGAPRLLGLPSRLADRLPEDVRPGASARFASVHHWQGATGEAERWEESAAQVQGHGLDDLPLRVLVTDQWPAEMLPVWIELQRELAALSSRGTVEIVAGADHAGIVQDPRFAPRVAAAVRDVIAVARGER